MFANLLTGLTNEQRSALDSHGVGKQRLHEWKTGKRLPTEVQVVVLAHVTGTDRHALQDEIALLRATPDQRALLARVMGKIEAGAKASIALVALVAAGLAGLFTQSPSKEVLVAPVDNVYYVNLHFSDRRRAAVDEQLHAIHKARVV